MKDTFVCPICVDKCTCVYTVHVHVNITPEIIIFNGVWIRGVICTNLHIHVLIYNVCCTLVNE